MSAIPKPTQVLTRQKLGNVGTNVNRWVSHEEEGIDKRPSGREDAPDDPNSDSEGWHGGVICGITVGPNLSIWRVFGRQDCLHFHFINEFDMLVGSFVNVGVVEEIAHPLQRGSREILIVFVEVVDMRDDVDCSFQTEVGNLGLHGQHLVFGNIEITRRSVRLQRMGKPDLPPDVGLLGSIQVILPERKFSGSYRYVPLIILLIVLPIDLVVVNRTCRWRDIVAHGGRGAVIRVQFLHLTYMKRLLPYPLSRDRVAISRSAWSHGPIRRQLVRPPWPRMT
jgi:hypothetical protein